MTPLTPADLATLAKTGCRVCHGRGRHVRLVGARRESTACLCVLRRDDVTIDERGAICRRERPPLVKETP